MVAPSQCWYLLPGADGFGAAEPATLADLIVKYKAADKRPDLSDVLR